MTREDINYGKAREKRIKMEKREIFLESFRVDVNKILREKIRKRFLR